MRGARVAQAKVERRGLAGDRRWMVVDGGGKFISQRERPQLTRLTAEGNGDGLTISGDGVSIAVYPEKQVQRSVRVWRDMVTAKGANPDADAALSDAMGEKVHLVFMDEATERPVDPSWGEGEVSFADGFPILVTNIASLRDLNQRLSAPVVMERFRPNVVIDCDAPWAEDGWKTIEAGSARLSLVKPCGRCVVTTTDQATGARPSDEPLRTLATFRRSKNRRAPGVLFGWNATVASPGIIAVGDTVSVSAAGDPWPVG